jgi:hypothetical protein
MQSRRDQRLKALGSAKWGEASLAGIGLLPGN